MTPGASANPNAILIEALERLTTEPMLSDPGRREGKRDPEPEPQRVEASESWPALDSRALRGVIGDLVRAIEPHSEADVVALLIQGLIAFGSTLNRAAYFSAEADRHRMNLNAVLVGETAKGEKEPVGDMCAESLPRLILIGRARAC